MKEKIQLFLFIFFYHGFDLDCYDIIKISDWFDGNNYYFSNIKNKNPFIIWCDQSGIKYLLC